jgi:hypothetical protein
LEIKINILGPKSIVVAETLHNIGAVYFEKGYFEVALENYNECLKIQT